MTAAYNVVRMKVKPGREKEFLDKQKSMGRNLTGMRKAIMIKTGDRSYCIIGEWEGFQSLVDARPALIKTLDGVRDLLEDLGGGLGVTDPVSGEVVLDLKA